MGPPPGSAMLPGAGFNSGFRDDVRGFRSVARSCPSSKPYQLKAAAQYLVRSERRPYRRCLDFASFYTPNQSSFLLDQALTS